ncbi:MAG: carbohydrate ABC transporter permease [Butyrivibrio sp.]|jgi:multiple sugar transport system permease protein/putative aldouronate transport system permease protein|uniref:Carbohydrate ABC transporter permease n=1 Tax=Butyrivibrio fibrisolvens TaxID=831 RepID=A0A317G855_BUTFI|nr:MULTISPECIES: carbohydrate ABC transporter permease [Butyrivibrio]MBQ1458104.1 carbohydrate ABC transporter permease [Butyrivibrio sp.]PWT28860.1 carbohydrate ABC transporter permease [Butyrivibrio fibrisolvens]SEQ34525.1 putative aldouronate transport system permease protein [Butyrivibrio sp. TB]
MAKKDKKIDYDTYDSSARVKLGTSDYVIRGIGYVFVTLYALACIFPFLLIIGTSFTSEAVIRSAGVQLFPRDFTTEAYDMVLKGGAIWKSYLLTILMTGIGTGAGLIIISMTGYALQRKDFVLRNVISFFIYFTSLFQAGLAPYYLLMTQTYHLKDSYFAVLLPLLMSPWLIILMKNFVKSIPFEITESGKIDGAGDMKIFTSLILPMLKPALATIGLFLALGYWNEWYQSSLFLSSKVDAYPLQYMLYKVVNEANSLKNSVAAQFVTVTDLPTNSLKMATAVVATGPIVLLYPFVQRYFIGGITVGAVKG